MQTLRIDVWSDIACPWCYVGKRRLEAALAAFPHRSAVEVVWRAFELDPEAPPIRDTSISYAARLASKYGVSVEKAEGMIQSMTDVAAQDGLTFRFDRIQAGNTFDAHRLLHLAHDRGVQDAVKERFLLGYMTEGVAIGDRGELLRLSTEAGLAARDVEAVLASDAYAREVRSDENEARQIGISGVPFFALARRFGVSGAQPAEALLGALTRAWQQQSEIVTPFAEGAACGPDGCA